MHRGQWQCPTWWSTIGCGAVSVHSIKTVLVCYDCILTYSYSCRSFFSSFSIFLCDDLLNLPWFWLQYLDWSWVWHGWHITVAMIWEVCNFNGRCWKFGWLKGQNLVVCDFAFLTRHDTLMPVCQTGYMCMVRPFWYLITQTLGGLWEPR